MNLFGIGIDVIEVDRIESSIAQFGDTFTHKIFTEKERLYCDAQKRPAMHYAARFACKEAVSKALGTGIGKHLGWLDMEVIRKKSGEPELKLMGKGADFAKKNKLSQVKTSITHAQHYAASNAVALCEG